MAQTTITSATVADWHRRATAAADILAGLLADMEAAYSHDDALTDAQFATVTAAGSIRAASNAVAHTATDGPRSPFGRIAALVSDGKVRPPHYGVSHYGSMVTIDCPAGGQPLPPGTRPAQRRGASLDPSASMNPRSNREVGIRKHDAYHCPNPHCSRAYVALDKNGNIRHHRTRVMRHDYDAGRFDV